jgi:hypothetical protein
MVDWLEFCLRAWCPAGGKVAPAEFLERLRIAPGDPVAVDAGPGCPRVRLLFVAREHFDHIDVTADAGARSEAFAAAVHDGLLRAAAWLSRQPPAVFADLRAAGRATDVFVGGWIEQDQFDLDLPPEFLRACAALGLALRVCTND